MINSKDKWGFTALHEPAQKGMNQMCSLLLAHGDDLKIRNKNIQFVDEAMLAKINRKQDDDEEELNKLMNKKAASISTNIAISSHYHHHHGQWIILRPKQLHLLSNLCLIKLKS